PHRLRRRRSLGHRNVDALGHDSGNFGWKQRVPIATHGLAKLGEIGHIVLLSVLGPSGRGRRPVRPVREASRERGMPVPTLVDVEGVAVQDAVRRRFSRLAAFSAVYSYLLIVFGGIVRITGSGLGCGDDWPLCNGQILPPWDLPTWIEWIHRLLA